MARQKKGGEGNGSAANLGFEAKLWLAADKLRNNMDAEAVADDGEPFEEKMPRLVAELHAQFAEAGKREAKIKQNLASLGFSLEQTP